MLETNIKNRELLINSLKEEFIGPIHIDKTNMKPLVIAEGQVNLFHNKESFYNEFYYKSDTEEEIIKYPNTPIVNVNTKVDHVAHVKVDHPLVTPLC